ncbi:phosphatidylethanolamine-binding protein [Catenaria anguillulae PL171]|uniref:Phosphatidylethanolamine-binding protein n=1 Tax=Catenaria anguillulae PL171 TaxID=765915 RepID=A0A1Y2I2U3_9FUNG|nr:phosphatidylethanolamine-binding protein [Catenaria anguillulae PL171]
MSACSGAAAAAARRPLVSGIAGQVSVSGPRRTMASTAAATTKSKANANTKTSPLNPSDSHPHPHPAFTHAQSLLATANALAPHQQLATIRAFRHGQANFALPEFRTLGLRHFITRRRPRLVQFAEQRHVFSDFFPKHEDQINVEVHVAATAAAPDASADGQGHSDLVRIELGADVRPTQMMEPLKVCLQPYHEEVKKYTFVLVDGDMARPDWEMRSEQVLWMVKDIPLSAATATAPLPLPTTSAAVAAPGNSIGTLVVPYVPPHPTRGTGAHRILAFAFEQSDSTDIPATLPRGISLWELIQAHKLTPRGIHVWKAQWDASVSKVFTEVLNVKEPVFVTRPKIGRKGVDGLIENRYEGI